MVFLFCNYLLVSLLSTSNNSIRSTRPDASNIQLNWQSLLGKWLWNRQATLLLAWGYLELYKEGKIKLEHHILPYNPKLDLKTI